MFVITMDGMGGFLGWGGREDAGEVGRLLFQIQPVTVATDAGS